MTVQLLPKLRHVRVPVLIKHAYRLKAFSDVLMSDAAFMNVCTARALGPVLSFLLCLFEFVISVYVT